MCSFSSNIMKEGASGTTSQPKKSLHHTQGVHDPHQPPLAPS